MREPITCIVVLPVESDEESPLTIEGQFGRDP